jgi:hypothetical protein
MDDPNTFLLEMARTLERRLGLKQHFLEDLMNEADDWSFVIKVHAFIEAALGHLILVALDRPQLEKFVRELPVSGRTGKVALAESMNLLSKPVATFINNLGQIRNRFAHRPHNVDLRIEELVNTSNKEKKSAWRDLCSFRDELIKQHGAKHDVAATMMDNPRAAVWVSALHTAGVITENAFRIESQRSTEEQLRKDLEQIALHEIGVSRKNAE